MTTDREVACYDEFAAKKWALNSAVECHPHTVEVVGSNPTAPTIFISVPGSHLRLAGHLYRLPVQPDEVIGLTPKRASSAAITPCAPAGRPTPYRETHALLDELAEATLDGTRKEHMEFLVTVPLLILDDLGMRKLPLTAAEELLEIIMRRYERASTMLTSNRPVEDWGKLLGDAAAVSAMLDRLLRPALAIRLTSA
jgi:hypothetical protein